MINEHKSWGNKFIDNLATDIRIAFPESKGYSVRNLKYMAKFAETYPDRKFVQTASAQISWFHILQFWKKSKTEKIVTKFCLTFPKKKNIIIPERVAD